MPVSACDFSNISAGVSSFILSGVVLISSIKKKSRIGHGQNKSPAMTGLNTGIVKF